MASDDHVDPQDMERRNSPKGTRGDKAFGGAFAPPEVCYWNDKKYSDGATVCDAKRRYQCWNGKWIDAGNC